MGGSYKMNSVGFLGNSTQAFKIWRGGKCSVAVPSTLHVIFIFDSHSTVPIGCCCHRPRIYAAHSIVAQLLQIVSDGRVAIVARLLSRLAVSLL